LFPGRQRWEQISRAKIVVGVVFAALLMGMVLGACFYLQNSHLKAGTP
jgi:hypothetical protein